MTGVAFLPTDAGGDNLRRTTKDNPAKANYAALRTPSSNSNKGRYADRMFEDGSGNIFHVQTFDTSVSSCTIRDETNAALDIAGATAQPVFCMRKQRVSSGGRRSLF